MKRMSKIWTNILCKLYTIKWRENFILIFLLIIIWPVGLYQMWKNRGWNVVVKSIITAFIGIIMAIKILSYVNFLL